MDLHPPDQPIRTLKDFALHLCVVTVGILIEQLHRCDSFIASLDSAGQQVLKASDDALRIGK